MEVIDLTHTISEDMPVFSGSEAPKLTTKSTYEKDGFKETLLQMYSHVQTHMDPPTHIFAKRRNFRSIFPRTILRQSSCR